MHRTYVRCCAALIAGMSVREAAFHCNRHARDVIAAAKELYNETGLTVRQMKELAKDCKDDSELRAFVRNECRNLGRRN